MEGYWCYWHGDEGLLRRGAAREPGARPERPRSSHPAFDYENRIVTVRLPTVTVASVYVPNGGKDYPAKMRFLAALEEFAADCAAEPQPLVICGDLNIARTDMDVHPKERKPDTIGQLPEERDQLERIIGAAGWSTSAARSRPTTTRCSRGGRRGGTCGSGTSAGGSTTCSPASRSRERVTGCVVQREFGTSDHAPVVAVFE